MLQTFIHFDNYFMEFANLKPRRKAGRALGYVIGLLLPDSTALLSSVRYLGRVGREQVDQNLNASTSRGYECTRVTGEARGFAVLL